MVRLQTLDLRIGVRVPASQPLIRKNLCRTNYGASALLPFCRVDVARSEIHFTTLILGRSPCGS
jgi:hypothetical protein